MSTPSAGPQPETPRPGDALKGHAQAGSEGRGQVPPRRRPEARSENKAGFLQSIQGPLWFSFVLGLIGGFVVMLTASGGSDNPLRVDLGLIAFGTFFMVSLVVVAMLQLAAKDNPEHLSRGSGIHRSSEELHRQAVARRKAESRQKREEAEETARKQGGDGHGDRTASTSEDPKAS